MHPKIPKAMTLKSHASKSKNMGKDWGMGVPSVCQRGFPSPKVSSGIILQIWAQILYKSGQGLTLSTAGLVRNLKNDYCRVVAAW